MQRDVVYEVPCAGRCGKQVGVTAFADSVRKSMDLVADTKGWPRLRDDEIAYCEGDCATRFELKRDALVAEFRKHDWAGFEQYRERIRSGMSEGAAMAEAPKYLQRDTYFKARCASFATWFRERNGKSKGKDY